MYFISDFNIWLVEGSYSQQAATFFFFDLHQSLAMLFIRNQSPKILEPPMDIWLYHFSSAPLYIRGYSYCTCGALFGSPKIPSATTAHLYYTYIILNTTLRTAFCHHVCRKAQCSKVFLCVLELHLFVMFTINFASSTKMAAMMLMLISFNNGCYYIAFDIIVVIPWPAMATTFDFTTF